MMATVTHVDEAWTTNGDGGITVSVGNDLISVSVVGWPGPKPATEVKLKTVKYLTEMVGKKVVVCGSWEGHSFVATSIKEYP